MNRIVGFILFFSIFFTIYFGLHFYVFTRLATLFGIQKRLLLYVLIFALAFSFPLFSILERFAANFITRSLYTISATWLGILWYLFVAMILYEIFRLFLKLDQRTYGYIIIGLALALSIFSIFNALFLNIKTVQVPIKGLKEDVSIVQLTDMHVGTIHNSGFIKNVVEKTNELDPDLVVITGDLVDSTGEVHKESYSYLSGLDAPAYFVTGNHEVYSGINETLSILDIADVKILRNEAVTTKGLQLIGVDDPGNQNRHITLSEINYDKDRPTILLRHQPALLDDAASNNIALQLSGHTHNGQMYPFNFLVRLFYRYTKGLHNYNGLNVYISPGTGTWGPPMRLGSRSEITLFHLTPA